MKKFSKKTYFLTGIIAIAAMFIYQSCTFNVSTASISAAELVKIVPGGQSVKVGTTFHPNDGPFHLFVVVANGPADTKVKASWYGMEADGKSVLIDENGNLLLTDFGLGKSLGNKVKITNIPINICNNFFFF